VDIAGRLAVGVVSVQAKRPMKDVTDFEWCLEGNREVLDSQIHVSSRGLMQSLLLVESRSGVSAEAVGRPFTNPAPLNWRHLAEKRS
jgi:hypothetical protein